MHECILRQDEGIQRAASNSNSRLRQMVEGLKQHRSDGHERLNCNGTHAPTCYSSIRRATAPSVAAPLCPLHASACPAGSTPPLPTWLHPARPSPSVSATPTSGRRSHLPLWPDIAQSPRSSVPARPPHLVSWGGQTGPFLYLQLKVVVDPSPLA
jgi:hypothetical protein